MSFLKSKQEIIKRHIWVLSISKFVKHLRVRLIAIIRECVRRSFNLFSPLQQELSQIFYGIFWSLVYDFLQSFLNVDLKLLFDKRCNSGILLDLLYQLLLLSTRLLFLFDLNWGWRLWLFGFLFSLLHFKKL